MNLNSYRLNYEQMQTIVNKRPLTYTEPLIIWSYPFVFEPRTSTIYYRII